MNFPTHVRAQLITALGSISLWVQDLDDDPRKPTITVGFNTERWNFAFWLQNEGANPPALVEAVATWVRTEG